MSQTFYALGLMSGTSLDGIDAAFLKTDGQSIEAFGPSLYREYKSSERAILQQATQAALNWKFEGKRPEFFNLAETCLRLTHIEIIETLLKENPDWAQSLDVIGFHGQTVLHHPPTQTQTRTQKGRTLQLGDGAVLTKHFSVPCVYDFRTADMAAGGQGAPLAPIYHKALCDKAGLKGVSGVLNLGGVGNVTLVGDGVLKASDTGPANGPLDQWMQRHGQSYDKGGAASLAGIPDFRLLKSWADHLPFFNRPLPRSADRYDFGVLDDIKGMSLENGAATLAAFCAFSVAGTLSRMGASADRLILCGGGRHNQAIRLMLSEVCHVAVMSAEQVGWDSDMIEAQAFAYLAVRSMKGLPISFPETTGAKKPLKGGVMARA